MTSGAGYGRKSVVTYSQYFSGACIPTLKGYVNLERDGLIAKQRPALTVR